ncbi:MAG: hypothetical protein JKY19_05085 [Alcanivoracaceae bacterium]|nr:hypothetical protein [Alcanivoracaceae bacterium]
MKWLIFALLVTHARACSIAYEILWLLKGGFADGAQARWRALHEVSIITQFICEHDSGLAIRYLDHEAIKNYKAMNQYNEYVSRLNVSPIEESECEMIRNDMQMAIEKYGKEFKGAYGWASEALNKSNPNFFDIEKATNLDHMRPYYKWASHNVHANSKGLFNKLGMVEAKEDGMLAGASNSGLSDPADQTALTMSQITTKLLLHDPNVDEVIMIKIIEKLCSEVGPTFLDVENSSSNSKK